MATPTTYKGFSTNNAERTRNWQRFDIDLVKIDMMNHFMTRMGERIGRPGFGTYIWDYLNEPMTQTIRQLIVDDAVRIVQSDPRVKLHTVNLFDFENGIRIEIIVDYIGLAVNQTFQVDFETRQSNPIF